MASLSGLMKLSGDRVYWVDGRGTAISGYQLETFLSNNNGLFASLSHKNIAIFLSDLAKAAQMLFTLDGHCDRLFLVPADVQMEWLPNLFEQADISVLVTDKDVSGLSAEIDIVSLAPDANLDLNDEDRKAFELGGEKAKTEWIVATSGTTGTPKLVVHTLAELSGSLKTDQAKGNEFIWGLLYDLSKYAGLQVYLQALLGGSTLLIPDQSDSLSQQVSYFVDNKCNALSATPTLWRKILMLPLSQKLQLKRITLGGEIADQSILNALNKQFPNAKIAHIYASTEAGVGFSVSDGLAGFPSDYLTNPPRGVSMKVADNNLFLKSANIAKTLLNAASHTDHDGYIDTGDLVELRDDRYYFLGRASGLINVGGNKVYPEEVEQVLLSHEQVSLARVYAKESHIMGNLVVCDLVLNDVEPGAAAEVKKQIRAHCSECLSEWKIPAQFKIVESIDNNASGKQVRR